MIELINFGKEYGDFTAVQDVSMKIEAGELFGEQRTQKRVMLDV